MRTKFNGILTLLLALVVQISFAQDKTISGTVSDESGPLPGVTVLKKGTTQGTETDFDGNYTIKAKVGDVLVFSFVGMKSTERTVSNASTINVTLENDNVLEEVVVVGYGTKAKRATTGSITTIKSEAIENVPVANVAESLQGQAPGLLSVSASGQPGSNSSVQIRGLASVNGLTEPLYIIDGVPVTSNASNGTGVQLGTGGLDSGNSDPLSNINPADIESVTILKDASSTSIYGSRAANGIIMITTKKGKKGTKAKFDFSVQTGLSARAVTKFQVLNTSEFLELHREADINSGFTPAQALLRHPNTDVNTDWSDYAYRDWKAITKRYNFSVSGGNESVAYRTSLGYFVQDGIAVGSGLERYNANLNLNATTSDISRIGMNVSLSRNNQRTALAESAYFASPVVATYLFRPTTAPYLENGLPNTANPVTGGTSFIQDLYYDTEGSTTDRVLASVYGELDILDNLTFKTQFGTDNSYFNFKSYSSPQNTSSPSGGGASRAYQYVFNYTWTNTLNWKQTFGDDHKLNVLFGQEINHEGIDNFSVSVEKFPNSIIQTIGAASEVSSHSSQTEQSSLESYFANANYSFAGKYNLNTTIRRDGSSRFGANNKWGTFWSVGANWIITDEDFMNVSWLNSLKLQASYGVQGNLPARRFLHITESLNGIYNGNPSTFPSSTLGNPDLKWEEQKMFDVGIEFGVLDNRITGGLTYFNRKTDDLIFAQNLEGSSGFFQSFVNVGAFRNSGFELNINAEVLSTKDFSWSVNANISKIKNEVVTLDPGTQGVAGLYNRQVGDAWNTFYLERWAGVDTATGAPMWLDENDNITFNYADANRVKAGNANPDYFGSFGTTFNYKNFDLAANFTFSEGNKIYNNTSRITNSDGAFSGFNQSREQLDRWQKPGDVSANPRRITGNPSQSNQRSTRWLEDGSFIRLRNVTLGYNFNKDVLDKTFFSNARLYLQGTNLLTFSNFNGDPEQALNGQHWFVYPNAKTVSLGLNVSF